MRTSGSCSGNFGITTNMNNATRATTGTEINFAIATAIITDPSRHGISINRNGDGDTNNSTPNTDSGWY